MSGSRLGWLMMIAAGLAAGGCVAESPETVERTEEIGAINIPPDLPPLCFSQPGCSLTYLGGYTRPLQQQLGCSQTYRYVSGAATGFLGGMASYCADTTSNRNVLRNAGYRIYGPGYCNDCLHVPATEIFVFWTQWTGPNCPSGCASGNPPVLP